MVQRKGWNGVRPYYWCDTIETRAVLDHLWQNLIHHPENGIYIKGTRRFSPNSIEINTIKDSDLVNINVCIDDNCLLASIAESIKLLMDDAYILENTFTLKREDILKNTLNLQYKWQPKDKK